MMTQTSRWCLALVAGALIACPVCAPSSSFGASDPPKIEFIPKSVEHPAEFVATGLPKSVSGRLKGLEPTAPAFAELFAIHVTGRSEKESLPAVNGSYRIDGSRLIFTPKYPPLPGLTYRARLRWEAASSDGGVNAGVKIERDVSIPKLAQDAAPPASVLHIYPTSDMLPENHLRFYIHFSQPMTRGSAYENLELLDEAGKTIDAALLEIGEELWDPATRRFTLLLDPGRVKRGLKPREELGPILENRKKYTLLVRKSWRDARGQALTGEIRKTFSVGPAIEEPIDTAKWTLSAPQAESIKPLVVGFPHPLDHALLERTLAVVRADGARVAGRVTIADAERRWEFQPDEKWNPGRYQLDVDTVLEDTAGNSIERAFEVDEQRTVTRSIKTKSLKIPFEITPLNSTDSNPGRIP